ncbi:hypothetical protein BGX26_004298 [Mortierella sp. AD094]|nr:hypothetical protein BGX26_004298 [Mortierella sp. AD094]
MNPSIFHIPLIRDEVIQYLTNNDLGSCALVSKDWHTRFTPVLWRNPELRNPRDLGELQALFRNQDLVQTLHDPDIISAVMSSLYNQWTFRNLRSFILRLDQGGNINSTRAALQWVRARSNLRDLELWISHHDSNVHQQLLCILQSHPGLRRFDMRYFCQVPLTSLQEIIEACSHLNTLHLINCVSHPTLDHDITEEEQEQVANTKILMNEMQDFSIRELCIRLFYADEEACILIPLLKRCPHLKKLTLESTFHSSTINGIAGVFRDGYCHRLKDLDLRAISNSRSLSLNAQEVLSAIGSIEYGESSNISVRGLQTIVLDKEMDLTQSFTSSLTHYHSRTLTTLHLPRITSTYLVPFVDLMHGLPNLRLVESSVWLRHTSVEGLDADDVLDKQWTCLGLTHLETNAGSFIIRNAHMEGWTGSRNDLRLRYFFDQIGRLKELVELELGVGFIPFTNLKGPRYLARLSGLKKLKILRLSYVVDELGEEEAEWMIDNWPKLIYIDSRSELPQSPFIDTLHARRPNLQVFRE